MSRRPSIIFLFPDQLRADAIGAAGGSFVRTPNIDMLASESRHFTRCITNAPLCRPSRVSMMTGQPVWKHGVDTNLEAPSSRLPSHVRQLRDEGGYHTAVIGKTHLHNGKGHLEEHEAVLQDWGFCDAVELPDAQRVDVRSAHSDWLSTTTPTRQVDKFARWQDYVANHNVHALPPDTSPWHLSEEDHIDIFCARQAASYIRGTSHQRPLYLQVNFPGPHPPFDPPSAYLEAQDMEACPAPIPATSTGPRSPLHRRYHKRAAGPETSEEWRALQRRYHAKVSLVDRGIGIVLDALKDSGRIADTWIFLASDHGELLGDHGLQGKVLSYEPSIRVPLLIRPPGGVCLPPDHAAVDLLDVVASIVDVAGLRPPLDGNSLLARSHEAIPSTAKTVVFECMGVVSIRSERATLSWDRERACAVELYDRLADPMQLHNVIEKQNYQALATELIAALRAHDAI